MDQRSGAERDATTSGPRPFESRVALVTGAASGIGRATALRLAAGGARVACCDLDEAGIKTVAEEIAAAGGEARAIALDVADEGSARNTVESTVATFGGLQVLANVAGIGRFAHTTEATLADWNRIVAVNLTGVFLMCREALPHLLRDGGNIVNVASIAGLKGHAYGAAYSASKGGVVSLSRSLAIEYAKRGVRVNCVCPAGVITPLIGAFTPPEGAEQEYIARMIQPTEEMATPEQIAAAIAFLASDGEAGHITGAVLPVDGGVTA